MKSVADTLYIEGSLCMHTGAAGWGAVYVSPAGEERQLSGALPQPFDGAVTLMELAAAEAAFRTAMGRGHIRRNGRVVLASRSTAMLAVLRWVFPEAAFQGDIVVEPPKRLGRQVKDCQWLYDLHDAVEARLVTPSLRLIPESVETRIALELARNEMANMRLALAPAR